MSPLSSFPQTPNPPHPFPLLPTTGDRSGGQLVLIINPTNPIPSPPSYAATIGGQTNGGMKKLIRLEPRPYELIDGKDRLIFTKEEDDQLAEKCRLTVVGKFLCSRP